MKMKWEKIKRKGTVEKKESIPVSEKVMSKFLGGFKCITKVILAIVVTLAIVSIVNNVLEDFVPRVLPQILIGINIKMQFLGFSVEQIAKVNSFIIQYGEMVVVAVVLWYVFKALGELAKVVKGARFAVETVKYFKAKNRK